MKNKKILWVGFIIVLSVTALIFKYNFGSIQTSSVDDVPTRLPINAGQPIDQYDTSLKLLAIETPQGTVSMDDPRQMEETSAMGSGIFSLTTLDNTNPYNFGIIFNEKNGSFAIGLEKEPIAQARLDAEAYIQRALGISKEDMCLLNVFVGVPYSVNEFFSGKNLGLSFCPGSVSL